MNSKHFILILTTSVVLGSSCAFGQTTWTPPTNSDDNWGTAANWNPGTVPNVAGSTVDITAAFNGQNNVNLQGNTYTVGTMNIGNTGVGDTGYYYLNGGTLNFNNNGNGAVLNDAAQAGGEQINNTVFNLSDNLTVNDNQVVTSGTPWGLEFGYGANGGPSGGESVTGTGNLTVNDNNPNGSAVNGYGQAVGVFNTVNNTGAVIMSGDGTGSVSFLGAFGSAVTEVDQNSSTASTQVTGFLGTTNVNVEQGTMQFNNLSGGSYSTMAQVNVGTTPDGAPSGFTPTVLDARGFNGGNWTTGNTQTFTGYGSVWATTITTVAGTTIAPGSTAHDIGKLNFGVVGTYSPNGYDVNTNLNLAAGTNLTFVLGSSGQNSSIDVVGTLTVPTLQLNLTLLDNANTDGLGSLGLGTYDLMNYLTLSGATAGDVTSLFDITAPAGYSYTLTDNATGMFEGQSRNGAGEIDLIVAAETPEPGTWAMLLGGLGLLAFVSKSRREKMINRI